jgi:hypothetical protein
MSARALTLYDTDSDSDASSLAGDVKPMASMSIANDPCRGDSNSDRFMLDSDLETTYSDSEEDYITSEQAQKYNPANLRVEARRTLDYDSESDDDGDANRGYSAQNTGGFNRSVMANGLKDDEDSIGDDSDYDPIIRGRKDLPRAFVSSDAELTALLPVGHARDKLVTTATINPETGRMDEIRQHRQGDKSQEKVIKIVSGAEKTAKQSADIVAKALAKARADKAKMVPIADRRPVSMGGRGENPNLTEDEIELEKRKALLKAKFAQNIQQGAKKVQQVGKRQKALRHMRSAIAELPTTRQKEIFQKDTALQNKKELMEEIAENSIRDQKLEKIEGKIKKAVDKRMMGEAFKKMKTESQARAVFKTVQNMVNKSVALDKITTTFTRIVAGMKAKAHAESEQLEAEIAKQERQALANLLTKKGLTAKQAEDEIAKHEGGGTGEAGGDEKSVAETATRPKSVMMAEAKEELDTLNASVKQIEIDGKELKVDMTGGRKRLLYDGKVITSNKANLDLLDKLKKGLADKRRTDPLANAIREIVDSRFAQANSTRGKGTLGGQGKRATKADGGAGKA